MHNLIFYKNNYCFQCNCIRVYLNTRFDFDRLTKFLKATVDIALEFNYRMGRKMFDMGGFSQKQFQSLDLYLVSDNRFTPYHMELKSYNW